MKQIAILKTSVALSILLSITANSVAGECGFQLAFERPDEGGVKTVKVYEGNPVPSLNGVKPLLFISDLKVNTDGTKISYHQDDPTGRRCVQNPNNKPCAINNIRNAFRNHRKPVSDFIAVRDAGYPPAATWRVLSKNIIEQNKTTKKPCITSDGYLVSMTADVAIPGGFNKVGDCDQSKWIDALTMPGVVLPKNTRSAPSQFKAKGVRKRSMIIALAPSAKNLSVAGIVGDFGPVNELGEGNIALNRALNGMPNTEQPLHRRDAILRFQTKSAAVILIPGRQSIHKRPISAGSIKNAGDALLADLGGLEKLYRCIRDEVSSTF